ncbi:MAG TPA: hypothetical protein PK239_09125 [Chitinophagales bacterium]|nr:hypothetical protein [Chitinophagales bacterium]HRK27438.1 hypothetical protein [Chitinophagales bacterium]
MNYLHIFIGIIACLLSTHAATLAQIPQSFNYQAVARNTDGSPLINTAIAVRISINTLASGGTTLYSERHDVATNQFGLFTLQVGSGIVLSGSFSSINWASGAKFIETALDPNGAVGGYSFLLMGTTQLVSVPYALAAQTVTTAPTLEQAYNAGGSGAGRTINTNAGAVEVTSANPNAANFAATHSGNGVAIAAASTHAGNTFSALQANTNSAVVNTSAILGNSTAAAYAVSGQLEPTATAESAIYGNNLRTTGGHGLLGRGFNGTVGETNYSQGYGVYGENYDAIPPLGNAIGVAGKGFWGVVGQDRYLGAVPGAFGVRSAGNFGATGTKSFVIDHPLDPENRTLKHFTLESNEVLNVYRGNAVLDANGEATIALPDYFEAINTNISYHLTPIGGFAPMYVKQKVQNNRFIIAGGLPDMEVSWTIYAERNDRYLQQYPHNKQAETDKLPHEKGLYFMPNLYGLPETKGIFHAPKPATMPQTALPVLETK